MASSLGRIARLTLFSGPNCSLCDIAKAELAKVRQTRQFQLETINIQDKGQERWKRKYVYWIPALHLEGKEIAKGQGTEGGGELEDNNASVNGSTSSADVVPFFIDVHPKYGLESTSLIPLYYAHPSVLGAEDEVDAPETRRCFNCGSPDHAVSDCPEPHNRALIALSRQYFNFFKEDSLGNLRFHQVEEWKRKRLE
ncbi:hypothetical protein K474DRAFT_1607743 [Panus rudis PR-1116 ss-1]|nr:hypothetical protein K474DRAFT_1607743 [Panus rudis PR-1116 ss-1]